METCRTHFLRLSTLLPPPTDPVDDATDRAAPDTDPLPPVNTQSMVPNLHITTTEADLIRGELTGRNAQPQGIPAPSIRTTPLDEASGNERIFTMAFPTLYPTGRADFNSPRVRSVSLSDYDRHLLCYHDGRFGRHPWWRFLVFNILMRRNAASAARFYVSKASGLKDLTREELAAALQDDTQLVDQIVRRGSDLTGTRPFWRNKSNSLTAQARFLSQDTSPVFVTFSAADIQWQDLHRHFTGWEGVVGATDTVRYQFIWKGIQDNPHIVAHYLQIRFRTFVQTVLRPLLKFTDHWDRFEWQARGSGHLHCLLWIPPAPSLDQESDTAREAFAGYWGELITAWNPDPLRRPDLRNPASLHPTDVANTSDQFKALVNRLQKHSNCTTSYCLRTNKETKQSSCRFFFPRPLFAGATITRAINPKAWLFSPARNDQFLNQCAPAITMGWLANTDIQPPTSLHAVLSYIEKYVSKPEKSSVSYVELQAQVLPYVHDRVPLLSFASKILNKLIGERDWSAQEVCHILLQVPVQDSSRMLVSLDCRPPKEQQELIILESGSVTAGRSVLRRYCDRLTDAPVSRALLTLSLHEWLRTWDWAQWRPRPRAQPRVINYYPRYSSDPTAPSYTDHCRVKLMLHHPFVVCEDLLTVDGIEYGSFTDAFYICHPPRAGDHVSEEESEEEERDTDGIEQPLADFEAFARRRPGRELDFTDPLDTLGAREFDRSYDWSIHSGRWIVVPEVWNQMKADHLITQAVIVDSCPLPLNHEQRKLCDTVVNHYTAELSRHGPLPPPLLLNVDGVAGSGKTFTLLKACARLQELATDAGLSNPVLRAAPTDIAAFNFTSKTLHSLLRLPVKGKTANLSAGTLQALQALFAACRFLIIDEKSMIDLKMLSLIDTRLRAIYPYNDQPFGGAFDQTVRLVDVMRQQGEDDIAVRFRAALSQLRTATLSQASWELLCTRTANQLSPDEVCGFDDALRLYYTTAEVRETNYNRLAAINQPVKKLTAEHKGRGAPAATEEEADNLSAEIYACIGARIMLTTNLWTEIGLVNGSMGVIEDVSWDYGRQTDQLPSVILIRFDSYTGPSFPGCPIGTVPVFPQTRQFDCKGIVCSRTQFRYGLDMRLRSIKVKA
ncbi:hypothetical protein HYALB_00004637 [Hymenoscyphus albidus]|uniref:ATP-dependent DNA helicase n=1 Tax=Hymenoscyphus albidus TaxID=595503 RepID=A0A9N9LYG2_9HELO|nr:hypothetical protein HYALB_00004637 [Hymenoscyphus albidus]